MNHKAIIGSDFPKHLIPLIAATKRKIKIIVYDWRFYPPSQGSPVSKFNTAILMAVKRGVHVQVLTNCQSILAILKSEGADAKMLHSKKKLHTKMMILDDTKVVLGSHNYTQSAFSLNHEASIFVDLETEENDFVKYFNNLFAV